ncbi:MAG: hypothetical protein ABWX94_03495 [Candidatus Saccharimonadales bacterium]
MVAFLTKTPKQLFWTVGATSVLLTLVVIAITQALRGSVPAPLPLATAAALFSFAAIPLFIMALKDFKHGLRRAYTLLCVGIILYGIGQLQFPLFEIIDGSAWVNSGAVILPYLISIGCIFMGVRRFGKLVGLKGLLLAPWAVLPIAVIVAAGSGLIVKGDQATVIQFELFLAVVLLFSTVTVLRIRSVTAERYRSSLTLLAASLGMLVFAAIHHMFTATVLGESNPYTNSALVLWPPCLSALLFMGVGYSFATISSRDVSAPDSTSPVDVITYVASFASNPAAIDKSLDTLRGITATLGGDSASLTKQQETALAALYKDLERYLITNEPLQQFSKVGLREKVRTRFQFNPRDTSVFWSLFTESN